MRIRLVITTLLVAAPAFAGPGDGVKEDEVVPESEIRSSVEAGALMPWTIAARHERLGLLARTYGGYDMSKDAPVMEASLEATLIDRVTLRATAANIGLSEQLQPAVGLLFDVVRESDHGLDLAVGGDYDFNGWNRMSALVTRVAAGVTTGQLRLQGNAAFGLAPTAGERYGDLRLSGLHPLGGGFYAGLDTRARVDLERDSDEPAGELDWDMHAGPVATLAVGRFSVSATGGVSAYKQRLRDTTHVGAIGAIGLGAAF